VTSGPDLSSGAAALAEDRYRFVSPLQSTADDFDQQGHLNNVATARYFQDLRVAYVMARLAPRWTDYLRDEGLVLVARELHVLYESEGMPGERFVGGVRIRIRQGKAGIMEERLVEAGSGRAVARAWIVQLLARAGRAVEYPSWYWDLLADAEGAPVRVLDPGVRRPWGPPV
jgi:acyl-CoA thioesterase FadM